MCCSFQILCLVLTLFDSSEDSIFILCFMTVTTSRGRIVHVYTFLHDCVSSKFSEVTCVQSLFSFFVISFCPFDDDDCILLVFDMTWSSFLTLSTLLVDILSDDRYSKDSDLLTWMVSPVTTTGTVLVKIILVYGLFLPKISFFYLFLLLSSYLLRKFFTWYFFFPLYFRSLLQLPFFSFPLSPCRSTVRVPLPSDTNSIREIRLNTTFYNKTKQYILVPSYFLLTFSTQRNSSNCYILSLWITSYKIHGYYLCKI